MKPGFEEEFENAFRGLTGEGGIKVVSGETSGEALGAALGQRYLGAGVGTPEFRERYAQEKVEGWCSDVETLAKFSKVHPHEAYSILMHSLAPRWRFLMRAMEVPPEVFQPLGEVLVEKFAPAAFGWTPEGDGERTQYSLPARHGGLGIPDPVEMAKTEQSSSKALAADLVRAILAQDVGYRQDRKAMGRLRSDRRKESDKHSEEIADRLEAGMEGRRRHAFEEARRAGGSAWLTARPLEHMGLGVDRQTFRDAVALRTGRELPDRLPEVCASCGEQMSLSHALKCKKGGWVVRRHREVLKAWSTLFRKVTPTVIEEPSIGAGIGATYQCRSTTTDPDARPDIMARGIYSPAQDAYFDVAVVDTGADSRGKLTSEAVLRDHERAKHRKYDERVHHLGKFVPLVCSVYGTLAPESERTLSCVTRALGGETEDRDDVAYLHRVCMQVAVIKATSLCLRARSQINPPPCDAYPEALADAKVTIADAGLGERGLD